MDASLYDRVNLAVKQTLAQAQIPGATLSVCIGGQPILQIAVGHRDRDQAQPLAVDARFYIYSVTKSLIAAAVLNQVKQGQLELDAPIQHYWPDFAIATPLTLRQILSHTSGLPDYGGLQAYGNGVKSSPSSPWSAAEFLDVARTQGLLFAPGNGWSYSNIGYLSLKMLLEQTTGQSMQGAVDELFFTPLALTQTFVASSLEDGAELTPGYTKTLGNPDFEDMAQRYHPGWVSHGVVISTASELAIMMDALMTGQILDGLLVEQMAQPVHSLGPHPPLQNVACGLGLFMDTNSPYGRVAGHNGGGPGYSIAAFHFSALAGRPTTIAAATNQDGDNVGVDVAYAVARVLAEA